MTGKCFVNLRSRCSTCGNGRLIFFVPEFIGLGELGLGFGDEGSLGGCGDQGISFSLRASLVVECWKSSGGCGGGSSVVTMTERACTVRTRKFMTNRLLARKQFVSDSL